MAERLHIIIYEDGRIVNFWAQRHAMPSLGIWQLVDNFLVESRGRVVERGQVDGDDRRLGRK